MSKKHTEEKEVESQVEATVDKPVVREEESPLPPGAEVVGGSVVTRGQGPLISDGVYGEGPILQAIPVADFLAAADAAAPVITNLNPESMEVPGPDAPITVTGTGFKEDSVIVWSDADEVTEFVSDTELRTLVKVSTVEAPLPHTLTVEVRNGDAKSNSLVFTFVAGTAARSESEHRHEKSHHRA